MLSPTTLTLQGSPSSLRVSGLGFAEHNGLCVAQLREDPSLSAQLSFLQEPGELI